VPSRSTASLVPEAPRAPPVRGPAGDWPGTGRGLAELGRGLRCGVDSRFAPSTSRGRRGLPKAGRSGSGGVTGRSHSRLRARPGHSASLVAWLRGGAIRGVSRALRDRGDLPRNAEVPWSPRHNSRGSWGRLGPTRRRPFVPSRSTAGLSRRPPGPPRRTSAPRRGCRSSGPGGQRGDPGLRSGGAKRQAPACRAGSRPGRSSRDRGPLGERGSQRSSKGRRPTPSRGQTGPGRRTNGTATRRRSRRLRSNGRPGGLAAFGQHRWMDAARFPTVKGTSRWQTPRARGGGGAGGSRFT
jgi:hypothetical protein